MPHIVRQPQNSTESLPTSADGPKKRPARRLAKQANGRNSAPGVNPDHPTNLPQLSMAKRKRTP